MLRDSEVNTPHFKEFLFKYLIGNTVDLVSCWVERWSANSMEQGFSLEADSRAQGQISRLLRNQMRLCLE
jgi:hypothetical protein